MSDLNISTHYTNGYQANLGQKKQVARELEATFLAEMLKHAKVGETPEVLGGGSGEDQFLSFLRQAQADAMVEAGGIGMAEKILEAMISEGKVK